MKLYELTWTIYDGEHEHSHSEIRVFPKMKDAEKYGLFEEYRYNTGEELKGKMTIEKRTSAQEDSSMRNGYAYAYELTRVAEINTFEGYDGMYEVILGKKIS